MASKTGAQDSLFVKATPNLLGVLFPLRWLWRWFTRRTGILFVKRETDKFAPDPVAKLLADGIVYGEGPRFRLREQALYFSDMHAHRVYKYDLATQRTEVVCDVPDKPSGLGWLPDGRLLIAAGAEPRQVLVFDGATNALEMYADMTSVTRVQANDMVVAADGSLFVGNFGFDHTDALACTSTTLVRVAADRSVSVAATGLLFPNGSVITPDGKTLIVAETFGGRLTAFDIAADGQLSNRRVWADVGLPPDGICLDAEGCVWAAIPHVGIYKTAGGLVRVREGGEVVDMVGFGQNGVLSCVFACQLGTDAAGKHHLFFLEAATASEAELMKQPKEKRARNAALRSIEVRVGPARSAASADYCGGYC
ncbi:hypothetical protein PybrP1_007190 [[Pythium] brassicae (nom. inval.)]|nr:hypothetical protein PybrP1_007190 [[Pythium] brassicae (nom. inval.)]